MRHSLPDSSSTPMPEALLFSRLCDIIGAITRSTDLEKGCDEVALTISRGLDFDVAAIERFGNDEKVVIRLGQHGVSPQRSAVALSATPTGIAQRKRSPIVLSSPFQCRKYSTSLKVKRPLHTIIVVPLRQKSKTMGALWLGSRETKLIPKTIVRLLDAAGTEISAFIQKLDCALLLDEVSRKSRLLFESSHDTILLIDPISGLIEDASPTVRSFLGYTPNEIRGKPVLFLHPEEEHRRHLKLLRSLRDGEGVKKFKTIHFLHKNGRSVPGEMKARAAMVGNKTVVVAGIRDITEQQRAEVQIAASEDLLRIIVDGTLDMFFYVHNAKGIFTYVSPSVETITGHKVNVWMDRFDKFLTNNPINESARDATLKMMQEGITFPPYCCEIVHAGGDRILLEINAKPILKDGKVIGVQGVARDITDRTRWEKSLLESEEKYRSLFNSVRDGIFQCDRLGRIVSMNTAGAEILGYRSPGEVIAAGIRWADVYTEDAERRKISGNIRQQGFVKAVQFIARRKNGDLINIEGSGTGIFDAQGNITGYDGIFQDISERKRLEEQLIQSQKMESIGLLAGGIAHDFNNILGGILGYASYLKGQFPTGDKVHQHLLTIERSALRAAELTSKLLAFARGGKYVVKPTDINMVINETIRLLQGSIDKTIIITDELAVELPAIAADAGQIQQVLMNLCVNARDAMPDGGRLGIRSDLVPSTHQFIASQPDVKPCPYVRVRVSDTGVGIDKIILGRIFEPFFTTKEKGKGTGLGLATVYGIVKNHGGFIDVQSEVGKGTSFTIYLPSITQTAEFVREGIVETTGGTETILVVDDEETIRTLVRELLTARGYNVIEATNGVEAVEKYEHTAPPIDLVILDMMMPEMGGRETFLQLKQLDGNVRAILSTGYAQDDRAREMMEMGVLAFVQKPYRSDDLAGVVRSVLDSGKNEQVKDSII
ncbi:MAG: PAS domain S-box protein [Bacteroidota bacterium]